jgi:hypothetical protein
VQEARPPQGDLATRVIPPVEDQWGTAGWPKRDFRSPIAAVSDRVTLSPRPTVAIDQATEQQHLSVGRLGTITAADVNVDGQTQFTAVSIYALWNRTPSSGVYADAAAHRILSDLRY